jgi:vacuolar protein sorting-associated protein 13A/C
MLLDGNLGNLQLIDLTNYPNTIHREEDWNLAKRTEMLGVSKEKGTSLLGIKFRGL